MTLRVHKKSKRKKGKMGKIPEKTDEQSHQLEQLMYLVANSLDASLERGFTGGVMVKKGGEPSDYALMLGISLVEAGTSDSRVIESLVEHTRLKKRRTTVMQKMRKLFNNLAAGTPTKRTDRYFSFKNAKKAGAAIQLLKRYGFEIKHKPGSKGFEIAGLPKDFKKSFASLKKDLVKHSITAFQNNKDAAHAAKNRMRQRETEDMFRDAEQTELAATAARRKKDLERPLGFPKSEEEKSLERLMATMGNPDSVDVFLGTDILEKLQECASLPDHWATVREVLESRNDIWEELAWRIQAEQTKVINLSPESFSVYQRLMATGLFNAGDAAFVAHSCNKYQKIHAKNKNACGTVNFSRFKSLEQRLAIVHTLREIDRLPVSGPMHKAFGRFYAHLEPENHGLLCIGYSTKAREGRKYSREGMMRAQGASRRESPEFRAADDAAKEIVSRAKPMDFADMAFLLEAGGKTSTEKFILALTTLKRGMPIDYVASTTTEMARFSAFVGKYFPGMETAFTRSPGAREEWYVSVRRAGTVSPETGVQWARKNLGPWVDRFEHKGKIASAVDNLGRETITITVPAEKNGAPGKPPAWFIRMANLRGNNLAVNRHFRLAMESKGVSVGFLPLKVKSRTEYHGAEKKKIPISHTYTIVLDGAKPKGALLAARKKIGLPGKKLPGPRLKPVDFGKPGTAIASKGGKKPSLEKRLAARLQDIRERGKKQLLASREKKKKGPKKV